MVDGLKTTILRSRAEMAAIRAEWTALWQSSSATPFQSPEWLMPWWDAFRAGEPLIVTVRNGDRLVGLAPLYIDAGTVRLIGSGNTDYLDIIASPGYESLVSRAVFECVDRKNVDFFDLPAGSPLLEAGYERTKGEVCPVLRFPAGTQELDAMLAPRLRKGFRQYKRRFGEQEAFRFEAAADDCLEEYTDAFFRLHGARWQATGEKGVLADPRVQGFLRCAMSGLWGRGVLRLWGLRDGRGLLRGVQVSLTRGKRVFAYLAGFDPALEGFSAGTVMLRLAMEDAIRTGFSEWDFLRGGEAYKYDWGAQDEQTWRVRLPQV